MELINDRRKALRIFQDALENGRNSKYRRFDPPSGLGRSWKVAYLSLLSEKLREDYNVVMLALRSTHWAWTDENYQLISPSLGRDKSIVIEALKCGLHWGYVPDDLKSDYEVLLAGLSSESVRERTSPARGSNFDWVPEHLRNHRYFMSQACKVNPQIISVIGDDLLAVLRDESIKSATQDEQVLSLQVGSSPLSTDSTAMERLVRYNGLFLKYGSESIRNDRLVVCSAIRNNPFALAFASDSLRSDRSIVREAALIDPISLTLASASLQIDTVLLNDAFQVEKLKWLYEEEDQSSLERIIISRLKRMGKVKGVLEKIPLEFWKQGEFFQRFCGEFPTYFGYVPNEIRMNRDYVKRAILANPRILTWADTSFRDNPELRKLAGWDE